MSIAQEQPIVPPQATDKVLIDFSGIIQKSFSALFQAGHLHVGRNGPITAEPLSTDGTPGDVTIGVVAGSVYLYVKIDRSHWYRFGPAVAI